MDFLRASLIETKRIPQDLVDRNMVVDYQHGLVYPSVEGYTEEELKSLFDEVFPNLKDFQETFHKSWDKIVNTDQEELWAQAIVHYFTTYGLESLGIDNEGLVYVPDEVCDIPELKQFRVITTISKEDLIEIVRNNFASGVALKQETIDNYLLFLKHYGVELNVEDIKNKEVRTLFYYKRKMVPGYGEELIRVLNLTLTGKTMLVKDRDTFRAISMPGVYSGSKDEDKEKFIKDLLTVGAKSCAEVFYRNKPIFMALRKRGYKKEVNKIRRLAKYYWKPRAFKPFLSTAILSDISVTTEDLERLSVYDLVKVYNKLNYVIKMYPKGYYYDIMVVRNGSIYINKEQKVLTPEQFSWAFSAKEAIIDILKRRVNPNNKQIILPENLDIAFPTSEKSFIGDIPLYSQAICDQSSVVGIAWEKEDLDLSALLEDGGKVGWNSRYSDATKDVLYSGDQTRGGAEALFFKADHAALVMINVYYGNIPEVELFISNEKEFSLTKDEDQMSWSHTPKKYLYDPNNIVYSTKLKIDGESKVLGLYDKQNDKTTFTFADLKLGSGNVSSASELTAVAIEALKYRGVASLKLSDIFDVILPEDLEEQLNEVEDDDDSEAKQQEIQDKTIDLTNVDKATILDLAIEDSLLK